LKMVVCNPGISIYDLARRTDRNYSRVFKDVQLLVEMGEIESRPDPRSGRKARQLLPVRSINNELIGINWNEPGP
ncbi:MAG: MarR family transcriptional regulator, partial [Nitrospirae bacterium]|nr:MarR family transcriptional regulator [Nitrospirota bacterium]